ncbi:MAG: SH3 domain-containing protein [Clostridia bacterium]|nr:SH3 domain-containing protein [Clostridia bacterium]
MSKRFKLKPAGYLVLGILFLVIVLCIYAIIRALSGPKTAQQAILPESNPSESPAQAVVTPIPTEMLEETPDTTPEEEQQTVSEETSTPDPGTVTTVQQATPAPTPTASPRVPTSSEKKKAKYGVLNNDGVNLRSGPSTDYERIGNYNKGATMAVYAKDGDFYFVKMDKDGKVGFMSKKFITVSDTATVTIPPNAPSDAVSGKISASKVALRTGPNKSDSAIKELKRGAALFIYYRIGEFYYVEDVASGKKGFAYAAYVSADGSVPSK